MLQRSAIILILLALMPFSRELSSAGQPGPKGDDIPSQLVQKGQPLFLHYCAHCHGISGDGDGFNADQLDKEPAELSSNKFIFKKTDKQLYRVIKYGGLKVKKSHLMPNFGYTLSEDEIWSLVAYVRHLAKDQTHLASLSKSISENDSEVRGFAGSGSGNSTGKIPAMGLVAHESLESFSNWFAKNGHLKEWIQEGEKIFRKKKSCFACHQLEEEGGLVGPDLSRAGFYYTPEWIFSWIGNPQRIKPQSKMPNIGLNDTECRAVTAFLVSLKGAGISEKWKIYLDSPGDPLKGEKLFFDPEGKANCGKCHTAHGKGGKVGPVLSFVGSSRTKPFLLESILDPKKVITAGYSSILILTKKGKFITGVKLNEDDSSIDLVDKEGHKLHIHKGEIKKYKTQKISIMPGNFKDILTPEEVRNLLAYLGTLKLPN